MNYLARRSEEPEAVRSDLISIWADAGLRSGTAKFDWFYRAHPVDQPSVFTVEHAPSGALVGSCTLGWRRMSLEGVPILAANRCDLAVRPGHRRRGAAAVLLNEVLATGTRQADLVYGFPNQRAAEAVAKAGFRLLGMMQTYSKVLDWPAWLARRAGWRSTSKASGSAILSTADQPAAAWHCERHGLFIHVAGRPDSEFDGLWHASARQHWLMGVRDSGFLRWRLSMPDDKVLTLLAARTAQGRLAGYAVVCVHGCVASVVDFLVDPDCAGSLPALMWGAEAYARAAGCDVMHTSFYGADAVSRVLAASGAMRRAKRPIYAAGRLLDEVPPNRMYLTAFDEDDL